jgi:hypothetical protein
MNSIFAKSALAVAIGMSASASLAEGVTINGFLTTSVARLDQDNGASTTSTAASACNSPAPSTSAWQPRRS